MYSSGVIATTMCLQIFVVAPYGSATDDVPEEEIYTMHEDKHHELFAFGSVSLSGEVDKQSVFCPMVC